MLSRGIRDTFDWPLFVMVAAIALIGVVNLYSATNAMPPQLRDIYIQQIYWLTLGAGAAVLIASIDYRYYERYGWVAYGTGIVLLVLVFLVAPEVRGSQRWIPIGAFSLQPSELMKVFFIVALAKHLHDDPRTEGRTLKDLVIPGLILARAARADPGAARPRHGDDHRRDLRLDHVPDASEAALVRHARAQLRGQRAATWRYLLKDYQRERMVAFLDPENDILGKGWHAYQAKVAIGSGGITGKGFLQGTQVQHRFLPDAHSDFPFSVWAEEQGFIGSLVLVLLYLGLCCGGSRSRPKPRTASARWSRSASAH